MIEHAAMLTLANIPPDIIRTIVRTNIGEKMDNLTLIAPIWQNMIKEYHQKLPHLINLQIDLKNNVVILIFEEDHLKHFQLIDFKSQRIEKNRKNPKIIIKHIDFNIDKKFAKGAELLSMICQITSKIGWILVYGCKDKNVLEILVKNIRPVQVDGLQIFDNCTPDIRDTVKKTISRHQIIVFQITSQGYLYQNTWGHFIHCEAEIVPVLFLEFEHDTVSENMKLCWEAFAHDLINLRGTEKVVVYIGTNDSQFKFPYYREPWLEFMDLFGLDD